MERAGVHVAAGQRENAVIGAVAPGSFVSNLQNIERTKVFLCIGRELMVGGGRGAQRLLLAVETAVCRAVCGDKVGGESYADGTYTEGHVTVEVDSTVIEVKDNGVVDAGQTYGNVKYALVSLLEDGTPDSKAFTVKRQNYVDGNLYFKLLPEEGYRIVSVSAEGGVLSENTAGGELEAYEQVVVPYLETKEMTVTVTVAR